MSAVKTGNATHDERVNKAESVRQAAVVAAGPTMASVVAADVAFYQAHVASALANGINPAQAMTALRELGRWGP